jgi:hypothetical protein
VNSIVGRCRDSGHVTVIPGLAEKFKSVFRRTETYAAGVVLQGRLFKSIRFSHLKVVLFPSSTN